MRQEYVLYADDGVRMHKYCISNSDEAGICFSYADERRNMFYHVLMTMQEYPLCSDEAGISFHMLMSAGICLSCADDGAGISSLFL
jgi:hypothetical protein